MTVLTTGCAVYTGSSTSIGESSSDTSTSSEIENKTPIDSRIIGSLKGDLIGYSENGDASNNDYE